MSGERAWEILRMGAPVSRPVYVDCEDGIRRWLLPPGFAEGCVFTHIVCKSYLAPKHRNPRQLWQQEQMVYAREIEERGFTAEATA